MQKTITLQLPPISVSVDVPESLSSKEILQLGKKELINQLTKKFPKGIQYDIVDGSVIDDTDIQAGRPVKLKDSGEIGIIYEVKPNQKFPIKIALPKGKTIGCMKQAVETVSKRTKVEKLITGREEWEKSLNEWYSGKTAFLCNKGEIIPVVISAARTKVKAIIVGHESNGAFYNLTMEQANRFLCDTYEEAQQKND